MKIAVIESALAKCPVMALRVISRRLNKSVAFRGITDMAVPADGFVSVEYDPYRQVALIDFVLCN